MQLDNEIGKVALATPILICKIMKTNQVKLIYYSSSQSSGSFYAKSGR